MGRRAVGTVPLARKSAFKFVRPGPAPTNPPPKNAGLLLINPPEDVVNPSLSTLNAVIPWKRAWMKKLTLLTKSNSLSIAILLLRKSPLMYVAALPTNAAAVIVLVLPKL
jgi:hypothetical protein